MKTAVLYSPNMLYACFGPPNKDRLVQVWEGELEGTTKEDAADEAWRIFNGEDLRTDGERAIFTAHAAAVRALQIDHTSMSVGDAVRFEDGEILQCASIGWQSLGKPSQACDKCGGDSKSGHQRFCPKELASSQL